MAPELIIGALVTAILGMTAGFARVFWYIVKRQDEETQAWRHIAEDNGTIGNAALEIAERNQDAITALEGRTTRIETLINGLPAKIAVAVKRAAKDGGP